MQISYEGPGGSFEVDMVVFRDLLDMLRTINTKRSKLKRIGKDRSWRTMKKMKTNIGLKGLFSLLLHVASTVLSVFIFRLH